MKSVALTIGVSWLTNTEGEKKGVCFFFFCFPPNVPKHPWAVPCEEAQSCSGGAFPGKWTVLSEMMLPKKKRHNPLDVKGSTDFWLLSKLWRGQERSRAHPQPVDAALDSDALALDVAWGRQPFPRDLAPTRGSQGWWPPIHSQRELDVISKARELRAARGRRQLLGRSGPTFPSAFERSKNPIGFLGSLPSSRLVHDLP